MTAISRQVDYRKALAGVLTLIVVACAPAAPAAQPVGKVEKSGLRLGLAGSGALYLPIYLGAERTYREEGLDVEVLNLNGEAPLAQALASESVDLGVMSLNNVINLIDASQPVKGFYAGVAVPDLGWFAKPEVKDWADLKGRSVSVLAYGGQGELLTRHVLRKHGLEPERDVQLVQTGGSANALAALRAGRIDASLLVPPFSWQAEADGFARLGTRSANISDEWPRLVFSAKEAFLDRYPNTVRSLLRAHVRAIRWAKADREAAVQVQVSVLKSEREHAERAYAEMLADLDERGALPAKSMPVFWQLAVAAGDVAEPWPESRLFDRRFVDTFDAWAPR